MSASPTPASPVGGGQGPRGMTQLRVWHRSIQDTISEIQGRTSRILMEQEKDLLRSFRARLADLNEELERERRKNEFGSVEYVQQVRKLKEENTWLRGLSERLTEENAGLVTDAKRKKRQLATQEQDRSFLIQQLVTVKKESARLRATVEQLHGEKTALERQRLQEQQLAAAGGAAAAETDAADTERQLAAARRPSTAARRQVKPQPPRGGGGSQRPRSASAMGPRAKHTAAELAAANTDKRQRAIIARLQKQLEAEQGKVRFLRGTFQGDLAARAELRERAREAIARVQGAGALDKMTAEVRRSVASELLAEDDAVRLLLEAVVPEPAPAAVEGAATVAAAAAAAYSSSAAVSEVGEAAAAKEGRPARRPATAHPRSPASSWTPRARPGSAAAARAGLHVPNPWAAYGQAVGLLGKDAGATAKAAAAAQSRRPVRPGSARPRPRSGRPVSRFGANASTRF